MNEYQLLLEAIATLDNHEQAIVNQLLAKAKKNLQELWQVHIAFGTEYQNTLSQRINSAAHN